MDNYRDDIGLGRINMDLEGIQHAYEAVKALLRPKPWYGSWHRPDTQEKYWMNLDDYEREH